MNPASIAQGVVTQDVSPEELYQVMTGATSSDPQQVQACSKRFKEMLQLHGIFDALHQIAAERSVSLYVRKQASIQFKNEALKSWKSRKVQNDAHRANIRSRFLAFIDEEDDTIAECMQISVAKIARMDYPQQWPSLLTDLMSVIDQGLAQRYTANDKGVNTALKLKRSLQMLCGVLKEFSSIKMPNGMKQMSQMVESLHSVLQTYYNQIIVTLPLYAATPLESIISDLALADLVYKSLSILATWLWQRTDKMSQEEAQGRNAWIYSVFEVSALQLKSLIGWRAAIIASNEANTGFIELLSKHIRRLGKFFRRLCVLHPKRFVEIPGSADLVALYWDQITQAGSSPPGSIADSNMAVYPVRFLVQGMVLFKETLGQYTSVRRDGTPNRNTLSRQFVEDAVQLIVTRFLPLNTHDLDSWTADPEEWVVAEETENEQWEFELRACSERVLMQVSNQFPEFVTPLLQATFQQVADQPALDLEGTLQKEALYCALGRCCRRVKDIINFPPWIESVLRAEARDTKESAPILKRRIAWLLGKLMYDSCVDPNDVKIWEILVYLLGDRSEGTDTVVRLTAAAAIREGIDTLELDMNSFRPFLSTAVTELMNLIGEVDSFESKRRVDNALNVIIERAGADMAPIVPVITGPFPKLWVEAGTNWLFKNSLLVTVTNLVKAIGGQSTSLSSIVVPLVQESMKEGMNLDGDGIILWKEAMRNTLSATEGRPSLFELLPTCLSHLESNLDLLGSLLNIAESYFLLEGPRILELCSADIFKAFLSIYTRKAMQENQKGTLIALQLLIQTTQPSLWAEPLHLSGLFPYLLHLLIENETDTLVQLEVVYLFARIAMADRHSFLNLMAAAAPVLEYSEEKAYERFLDQWWAKFDAMSEPRHRKLVAMGITALVSTGRPDVLERVPGDIFNLWLDVFGEIKEARRDPSEFGEDETPSNTLQRHWELDDAPDDFYQGTKGTPEYDRRKQVYDQDPVRTTQLSSYVAAGLREAEAICGPTQFQQLYLSEADPTVLKQIQDEIARS
ncbi:ARM repeat-containing protein [Marasmius fiardii PR-910]|nr:ARM repeat-containing protein [Marasmius fiardii PR-910]